jgi:hypothetical protein
MIGIGKEGVVDGSNKKRQNYYSHEYPRAEGVK